MKDTYFSR